MHAHEIVKWQNNIAEDVLSNKLEVNENLINAVLEVAFQLAKTREESHDRSFPGRSNVPTISFPNKFPIPVPEKYFNDKGEVDLSKVTGYEARKYFIRFLGIDFPIGIRRVKS